MEPTQMHRVAVVTGLPTPYREPVFEELSRRPGVALRVLYSADKHDDVAWDAIETSTFGYDRVFLSNVTPRPLRRLPFLGYANFSVTGLLDDFDPTYLIVYGYNQLVHWLAMRWANARGVPFALRSDSNVHLDNSTTLRSRMRRRLLRRTVARAAGLLTVGTANELYWKRYGAPDARIFPAPYAIDNERVARLVGDWRIRDDVRLRLLYVGRLIERKGVDVLLRAFEDVCESKDLALTIVGDGPERGRLKAMQSPNARARTQWLGKLSNEAAIRRMGAADLFVLPSRYEPWGLVVNEAMAAGLPVLTHQHGGAAIDLVENGRTGWILEDVSVDALRNALVRIAHNREDIQEMGQAARIRIQAWSIQNTVDGMMRAIQSTCRPSPLPTCEVSHV